MDIILAVMAKESLLSINSHNYYAGNLQTENGVPITRNADDHYHGFGIKSMMLIVKKYGGTISFDAKNKIFNLNVLFPIRAGADAS